MARTTDRGRRQSGAALLLMMLLVLVAATAVLVSRLDSNKLHARQARQTSMQLAAAKQALIDYAVTFSDLHSAAATALPCPDLDASGATLNGESHTNSCAPAGVSVLGRFPWRTLGIAPPVDSSGECFWYAVSGSYKNAGGDTDPMINPDSNGQLQLLAAGSGTIIEGATPAERPVALVFAPNGVLSGQARSGVLTGACSDGFNAADYLDDDTATGISNAVMSGSAYALDAFAVTQGVSESHNDRVVSISRAELAQAIYTRPDFLPSMDSLTHAIAGCVAAWGRANAAANDKRLPWPARVALGDYRINSQYDDQAGPALSGRLPDRVDDSAAATSNGISDMLSGCDPASVADWNAAQWQRWQYWKDHFFYAVAEAFAPGAPVPSNCGSCLSVNGAGDYAAIVFFSGERLRAVGQVRDAPPTDADTKLHVANYLEGRNASNHPYSGGSADFETRAPDGTFNDLAWCIDSSLNVVAC